jgi:hypothetical protein
MDYQTAYNLLLSQGIDAAQSSDTLVSRLSQGHAPIPGQVTSVLLALKVVYEALKDATGLDRDLACSLHVLARESRQQFINGCQAGIEWPPLLDEDITRIANSVHDIFSGQTRPSWG